MPYFPPSAGSSGALTRITDTVLAAPAASFDLTAIPGTYRHLRLLLNVRGDGAGSVQLLAMRLNADATGPYATFGRKVYAAFSDMDDSVDHINMHYALSGAGPAGASSSYVVDFPDYAGPFKKKAIIQGGGYADNIAGFQGVGVWTAAGGTAVINQITVVLAAGNLDIGSSATLYGLS